jgi:hypothetical protein
MSNTLWPAPVQKFVLGRKIPHELDALKFEEEEEEDFSPSIFCFPLLIINPPLLHTRLSPLHEVCHSAEYAAHYHILCLYVWGFIPDQAVAWLHSNEVIIITPFLFRFLTSLTASVV